MKTNKELIIYLICGGVTTFVNYLLYTGLLLLNLPYLVSNSAAWAGAVLTAYFLNRRLVFHSRKRIPAELASFASLRFLTLLLENLLLWLLISRISLAPLPAKVVVSVVTVIGNYVLCKYKVFKKEVPCHG